MFSDIDSTSLLGVTVELIEIGENVNPKSIYKDKQDSSNVFTKAVISNAEYIINVTRFGYEGQSISLKVSPELISMFGNSITVDFYLTRDRDMIYVPAGIFTMGCSDAIQELIGGDCSGDDSPGRVEMPSFYISNTEITFNQYDLYCEEVGKEKPSDEGWGRGNRPVINVSWYDAIEYCNWLSIKEGFSPRYKINGQNIIVDWGARGYRLPTEAEWEYAAQESQFEKQTIYSGGNRLDEVGWYNLNSNSRTHPVGSKKANKLGIHDMSGNVWEWCWDWYGEYRNKEQVSFHPKGAENGRMKIIRGGSWSNQAESSRIITRSSNNPNTRRNSIGFRIVYEDGFK